MEEYLEMDDVGVSKEEFAALLEPIEKGKYPAKFIGLRKNEVEDPATGEKKFIGYLHATQKGGKKVVPMFSLISDDPKIANRLISGHVATTMRLFAELDKHLDLMTGTRIDPAKVEAARDKVVTLRVGLDEEKVNEETGETYAAKNTLQGVMAYRE